MAIAFIPEADREIDAIVARYPQRMAALIPVLYVAQREFGYLTLQVLDLVATRLALLPAQVLHTATFYTMLHKRPVGRFHLQVCGSISCYLRGGDSLLATIERELGIGPGETTADKLFTLDTAECLAACGTAPIVRVNETYHENMTPARLVALIDTLRNEAEAHPARSVADADASHASGEGGGS